MPLQNIVSTVKTLRTQQKLVQEPQKLPAKPIPNFIDATGDEISSSSKPKSVSYSTSITSIRKEFESNRLIKNGSSSEVCWDKCKCLKRSSEKLFCTKFVGLCVKESCPKRYVEI